MSSKDFYDILWVDRNASETEIKKAYRKLAMKWHPDKHKGDKKAEEKFKEINAAYQTLSDTKKKKQYDTFGSEWAWGQGFEWFSWGGWGWFEGFDFGDIFGGGGWWQRVEFDLGDIFWAMWGMWWRGARQSHTYTEPEDLDMVRAIEINLKDLLLGTKISVEWPDGKRFKITIPENTKPGTKFKVKGKGRKSWWKAGNLYIQTDAKMPKKLTDSMKEAIKKW